MPAYSNGRIPLELLVTFEQGYNGADGHWHHSLSPATYARHLALVKRAKDRTGNDLRISSGWSAYRPYDAQVLARRIHGNYAAMPGTSSHGGFWEGRQTLAVDYGNWAAVYAGAGGQAAFFEDCRAVGLSPGLIMPERGYPLEPWHVVDLNPWSAVPAFEGVTPFDSEEEDDMFTDEDRARLNAVYAALFGPKNVDAPELRWLSVDGARSARYGLLDIEINTQRLAAEAARDAKAARGVVESPEGPKP